MKLLKRCVSVCLALAMVLTGFNLDGFALKARAAANEDPNAYMGVMLTEEEFNKFSYTETQVEWDDNSVNENGLPNYWARYVAGGTTIDDVLQQLKEREKFFLQEGEDGYSEEAAAGADLNKTDEGYYAVIVGSIAAEEQTVTELAGVNGVFFDSHYFNNLPVPDDENPPEGTEWFAYDHKDLTMEVQTALTFRGQYNNLTLRYSNKSKVSDDDAYYPVTLRGDVAGTVKGIAEEGIESRLFTFMSSAYGISGFDKTLFLPTSWEDGENRGQSRGMHFCRPTAGGTDQISFKDICAAEVDEETGLPREIKEGTETPCGVDINIYYHEGYIPTISGTSNLGIWKNPDNEEETGNQNIALHYYEENGGHTPQSGEKVVNYGSAAAWAGNEIWCDSCSDDIDSRIDAKGMFYDRTETQFRVCRYENEEEYNSYFETGRWAENWVAESAKIEGALQALAYDSELNSLNAYYTLTLVRDDWDKMDENSSWETEMGALSIPGQVKGLRLTAEGGETENGSKNITGVLDTVNIGAETELDLTGWFRGKGEKIAVSGAGTLSLTNARINGNVVVEGDVTVSSRQETAVASLTGMKTLNLSDGLTIENRLGFAENGQLNTKEKYRGARILARSGATVEIPNLDCTYDDTYGNHLEIDEEVKDDGTRPTLIFSGERKLGVNWEVRDLRYTKESDEEDETHWKPEYIWWAQLYYYVPVDGDGNEDWENQERDLVVLDNTVYQIKWDYDRDNEEATEITLDGEKCTLLYQKLEKTDYKVGDIRKDAWEDEVSLDPYEVSTVEEFAKENPDIGLLKDPYTDNSYDSGVWSEWNCEYQDGDVVEYYVSGITDLAGIVAEYGRWFENENGDREFAANSMRLYPVQKYLNEKEDDDNAFTDEDVYTEEDGVKKYALFMYGDEGPETSSHYVMRVESITSLEDSAKIEITTQPHTYTGSAIEEKPVVKLKSGSHVLKEGRDYTLTYENNTNAGTTAKVTVTGRGAYTGTVTKTFTITAKALTEADVSLAAESAEYTGSEIKPTVTVTDGNKTLAEGTDYELAYENNTNVGTTAKVTVTGKGNYSGTVTKPFTITEKKPTTVALSACTISLVPEKAEYTGSAITPAVTVKDGDKTLTEGTDYTLTYENNINAGNAAKVTVTGKGNYTGTVPKTFTITAKTIANATVALTPSSYYYNGKACKPKVTVKLNGKELKAEDYSVSYSNNTNIGKASVTITGKNNYTGNTTKTFNITVKKGSSYTVGAYKYKISSNSEVSFAGLKSKSTKKVSVPKTVKIGGKTFKVTAVDAKALSKTGITSVTIESNVKTIGNSAFEGCSKLTKVTIGTGVTKIGTSTFKSCKKLGSITIKSTKLKTVGKNALKGIKSNAKIKVPSKKLKDYKKLLKGKGQGKKVKITK